MNKLYYLVSGLCSATSDMFLCHYILVALFWNQCVKCSLVDSTPETCLMENWACEAHNDNVIGTHDSDLATCREECSHRNDCNFMTFFDSESFPLHDYCMLFSSCDSQHECDHCRTEAEVCFETCSQGFVGTMGGENLLDVRFDVEDEITCKLLCSLNPGCGVYTYYNANDPTFANTCFMLTELNSLQGGCENCKTGFPNCGGTSTPRPTNQPTPTTQHSTTTTTITTTPTDTATTLTTTEGPKDPCWWFCAGKSAAYYASECCATTDICL